ncbi:MAG: hypothetical protein ACYC77_09580 [Coriobacteriia bacterium]
MTVCTKEEAVTFIQAMRLTLEGKVGFKWMIEKLASLSAYIATVSAENERLNAFIDSTNARGDYEAFRASEHE